MIHPSSLSGSTQSNISAEESERLRYSFRNERNYYKRKCDLTGKEIVSIYDPKGPYTVYNREDWFSDAYNPLEYGREFDFSRLFFDQFKELSLDVPYEHMVVINSENCDYCNFIVNSKNCYLSVRIDAEDVSYCQLAFNNTKDCIDCHTINACEQCYECIDSTRCHTCRWCQRCKQCSDCTFCIDCVGCNYCYGCVGLRHQEYCFFNEKLSKSVYEAKMKEHLTASHLIVQKDFKRLADLSQKKPRRAAIVDGSHDVTGDYIINSQNVQESFDIVESEDVFESSGVEYGKNVSRSCFAYYPEKTYELLSCTYAHNVRFSYGIYNSHDIEYCMMVHSGSHDCLGSVGLKKNQYVIFNKQYTEQEYRALREKIVEYMKNTGEYGRFFPPSLAHFAYNETAAQEYYPLIKQQALAKGYRWKEEDTAKPDATNLIEAHQLPDSLYDVPDDILNWAITCSETKKPFKLIKKELDFYRALNIPIPRLHPDERHKNRVALRQPRKLGKRQCTKCDKDIQTTYAPERPEKVFCEDCYLKEVY